MCVVCNRTPCHPACPNAADVTVDGCTTCFVDIKAANTYYKDDNGNLFCSLDCALEYYGIKETHYEG